MLRKYKWLIALFIAFKFVKAYAMIPLALSLGLHLAAAMGLAYDYFYKRVPVSGQSVSYIDVSFGVDSSVTESEITAERAKPPPASVYSTLNAPGPYTYTVHCATTNTYGCKRATGNVTFSGATVPELLQNIGKCPSDVCTFGDSYNPANNVSKLLAPGFYQYYVNHEVRVLNGRAHIALFFTNPDTGARTAHDNVLYNNPSSSGYYPYRLVYQQNNNFTYDCPSGYSLNTSNNKCDLTDIELARESGVMDGACTTTYDASFNFSDPDCKFLIDNQYMKTASDADGNRVVTVAASSTDDNIVSYKALADSSIISQVKATADGGRSRHDTVVKSDGVVNSTTVTNYPSNPPPLYPGDTSRDSAPGVIAGNSTIDNANLDVGKLVVLQGQANNTLEAIKSAVSSDSDPADGVDTAGLDGVKQKTDSIVDKSRVFATNTSCPSDLFTFKLDFGSQLGEYTLTDDGLFCRLLSNHQEIIRNVSIAIAFVSATLIVLGA